MKEALLSQVRESSPKTRTAGRQTLKTARNTIFFTRNEESTEINNDHPSPNTPLAGQIARSHSASILRTGQLARE